MQILLDLKNSLWLFLQVRWDDVESNRHTRVSPWEIEPSGPLSGSNNLITSGLKRTRIGLPSGKPEFPVPGWSFFVNEKIFRCFQLSFLAPYKIF